MRPRAAVLALVLCAAAGGAARAQLPTDTATRKDTAARVAAPAADTTVRAPVVRLLTGLGASLRPGTSLYRLRVIAPHRVAAPATGLPDSTARRDTAARRDSLVAPRDTTQRAPAAPRPDGGVAQPAVVQTAQLDTVDLGVRTTSVSATTYGGSPAWLLVSAGGRGGSPSLDSLFLGQTDLRPMHLSGSLALTRIALEFSGDSLFGATSAPTGRRSLVAAVPPDALVSGDALDAFLQVAPLDSGWRDSVHVAVIAPPTVSVDSAEVVVERSESAPTPLGPAACWVVVLRSVRGEQRLWVTKDTRTVVRATQSLAYPVGGVLERTLIATAPATPATAPPAPQTPPLQTPQPQTPPPQTAPPAPPGPPTAL